MKTKSGKNEKWNIFINEIKTATKSTWNNEMSEKLKSKVKTKSE